MKLIVKILVASILILPSISAAQTVDNSSMIALLTKLVATLEQELQILLASKTPTTTITTAPGITLPTSAPNEATPPFGSIEQLSCVPHPVFMISTSTVTNPQASAYGDETVSFTYSNGCPIPIGTAVSWDVTDRRNAALFGKKQITNGPNDSISGNQVLYSSNIINAESMEGFQPPYTIIFKVSVGNDATTTQI